MRGEYIFCTCVEFLTVLECKVEKKVNTHGRAILYGYISVEEEKLLLNRVMKAPLEQIYVLDEKGEKHCFFTGVVEELKIEVEGEVKKAMISFISGTILLDLKPNTRVFQDISMSYNELFRVINQGYSDAQTFLEEDEAIGEFTVQEVELTPTSITLTNHKGMMIRLDDEEGIQIKGGNLYQSFWILCIRNTASWIKRSCIRKLCFMATRFSI